MSDRETPLSCPFCGSDPMPDYCSSTDGPAYSFHCQAKDCPAWPSAQGETEADAIAAWNTRASHITPQATPEGVDARDILSGLSSFLGAGMGDDTTTAKQFDQRIHWGIEHLESACRNRAAEVVEECSKRPNTTWGEVKQAILADQAHPTASKDATPEPQVEIERLTKLLGEARDALTWALPLAERAVDDHRMVRIECGHSNITGTYKNGQTWVGIHQSEVDQIEAARTTLSRLSEKEGKDA